MDVISWIDAKNCGIKRYYTGRPCVHGHDSERLVSNRTCVICTRNKLFKTRDRVRHAAEVRDYFSKNSNCSRRKGYKRQFTLNELIAMSLRGRLNIAIKQNNRAGSAVGDLGCSILEFRVYIESLFCKGMTWENRGKHSGQWQLDHVRPLASFDLTDRDQFLSACHYTNYQPLMVIDHYKKSVTDRAVIRATKLTV